MVIARTDPSGRAYAGSQRQIQTYVNLHEEALNAAILRGLPELGKDSIELAWVSPLEKDGFNEYRDGAFLAALGRSDLAAALAEFWPRGGPQWDALASLRPAGRASCRDAAKPSSGVLLVEAKSYPAEMESSGCQAGGESRTLIEKSLAEARRWFSAGPADWCGPLYQFANRLAYLYFFRQRVGVPAWFVNVCFVNDPRTPTPESEWRRELARARRALGFTAAEIPFVADVFLPGLGREIFEGTGQARGDRTESRVRPSRPGGRPQTRHNPVRRPSILAGVDEFVDECLDLLDVGRTSPHYRYKTSHRRVASAQSVAGEALVSGIYDRIEANWPGTPCRSSENWRFVAQPAISSRNESPEKRFEKALVAEKPEWVNMIPVASGVLPDLEEGGRRIDLARECGPGWFEFVELKVGPNCDTPLRAAMEILGYGVIYLFSRVHLDGLGYDADNPLLSAHRISLRVLAPAEVYDRGSLQRLEASMNGGLRRLVSRLQVVGLEMDFCFEQFPKGVSWPPGEAMERRERTYSIEGRRA